MDATAKLNTGLKTAASVESPLGAVKTGTAFHRALEFKEHGIEKNRSPSISLADPPGGSHFV